MKTKTSWQEKLHKNNGLPKTETITDPKSKWGTGTMVIPAPIEVDEVIRRVPRGKLITINEIREALAKKHRTKICCPLTTGIFSWIAAHAAEEARAEGKKRITPWWRTLKAGGVLNPKYPNYPQMQKALLAEEGHKVIAKGKNLVVADYAKKVGRS